jgi:hypothetical protein
MVVIKYIYSVILGTLPWYSELIFLFEFISQQKLALALGKDFF